MKMNLVAAAHTSKNALASRGQSLEVIIHKMVYSTPHGVNEA